MWRTAHSPTNPSSLHRHWIDVTALAALSLVALFMTARFALAPSAPELGVAVIFAPWTPPEQTLARTVEAGAKFVRFGGLRFVAVAIPDDRDYPARARAAGAWLVVDPKVIAACLSAFGTAAAKP
jgi:hypothetical protein